VEGAPLGLVPWWMVRLGLGLGLPLKLLPVLHPRETPSGDGNLVEHLPNLRARPPPPHTLSRPIAAASVLARVSGNPYNIHLSQETPVRWVVPVFVGRHAWSVCVAEVGRVCSLVFLNTVVVVCTEGVVSSLCLRSAMFASQSSVSTVRSQKYSFVHVWARQAGAAVTAG
jgi:hypothetical protein